MSKKEITYVNHFYKKGEPIETARCKETIPEAERKEIGRIILDNFLRPLGYERIKETA